MLNINFLKKYILKKQKDTQYTLEELNKFNEEGLKDIIVGMIIMNKLGS